MSKIQINGSTYREEDVAFNWGVEYVKALIGEHSKKEIIDHPDGAVTFEKLSEEVQDKISTAFLTAEEALNTGQSSAVAAKNAQTTADTAQATANDNKIKLENSKLVYKSFQVAAGETFTIKPNMICMALPYGGKTLEVYTKGGSQLISGNVGFVMAFAAEIDTGEYANGSNHRVAFMYQPSNSLNLMSSYHNLIDVGAYLKNNGEGNAYVFALMREVDVK